MSEAKSKGTVASKMKWFPRLPVGCGGGWLGVAAGSRSGVASRCDQIDDPPMCHPGWWWWWSWPKCHPGRYLEQDWKSEDGEPRMTNPGLRSPNSSPKYQAIVSKEYKVTYQEQPWQKRAKLPRGERFQKVGWQEHRSYRCICPLTPLPVLVVAILSSPSSKYINHHHHSILVLSRGHIHLHAQCTLHYILHKSSSMLMQKEAVPA